MTEEQIKKDRSERVDACRKEIETILAKYDVALIAEDSWSPYTKVQVQIQFIDTKKYDAEIAQEVKAVIKSKSKKS